ncbi:MAG: alpha/beta hydrolase [Bacteroidota bacterium]
MKLPEWKAKGQYFSHKGHDIFYVEEGQGETLLLIHGFPTASWDWWQMWSTFAKKYHVLAIDMIGFGFSAKPKGYPYSILDQADIHEAFLEGKGVDKAFVISHDYGDTVAQELLARCEDRRKTGETGFQIEKLCFLNGGLFPETHKALLIQKLLMSPIGSLIGNMLNRKKLGKNFMNIFGPNTQPTEEELDEFWELIMHNNGKAITHLLIRYMAERVAHRARWVGGMQETDVPLRLINGTFDPISGGHMADRYEEIIPNPDVVRLEGIGHFPLIEAPEDVLKYALGFIEA